MGFQFTSANERLALEGLDDDLYPILGIHDHSRAHTRKIKKWPRNVCSGDIHASRPLYGKLPQMLPLTLDYLRQFRQSLDSKEDLLWSVIWYSDTRWSGDIIRPDNFRTVMTFSQSCIQIALQPVQVDAGTPRLYFGPGDIQDCLDRAIHEVEKADTSPSPDGDVVTVLGHGSAADPRENPRYLHHPDYPRIPFQWKIYREPEYDVGTQLRKWRFDQCGGPRTYRVREEEYLKYLYDNNLPDPRKGERKRLRPIGPRKNRKRGVVETDASDEMDSSSKRQSTDSYYSSGSQRESTVHSYTSSPEFPRPPPVAGPIMGPPFPPGPGQPGAGMQPWGRQPRSRGSMGSLRSASSYVGLRLAGLEVQSPGGSSPEGVPPPPGGSGWGGPGGMARNAPGQQIQGFSQQFPGPGYQGPGQVQQSPGYGQLTEEYGHLVPQTQQVARYGGQIPPPGQQHMTAEQAAAQLSHQHARAGLWPSQIVSGDAGPWSPNMPLPGPDPNIQHPGGYSPGFPPSRPAIQGGGAYSAQQSQHLAAAQVGGGNIPSNFSAGAPPMSQPGDMAPVHPPPMPGIDPSLAQPPTTRAPREYDQPDYANIPVSQSLQYPGDQGNVQFYQSPSPIGGDQPAYQDPFWGGSDSEGNRSG